MAGRGKEERRNLLDNRVPFTHPRSSSRPTTTLQLLPELSVVVLEQDPDAVEASLGGRVVQCVRRGEDGGGGGRVVALAVAAAAVVEIVVDGWGGAETKLCDCKHAFYSPPISSKWRVETLACVDL